MPKKTTKKQKVEESEEEVPSELDSQGSDAEGEQLGHGEADEGMESGEMDLDDEMIEDGDDMEEGEEEMEMSGDFEEGSDGEEEEKGDEIEEENEDEYEEPQDEGADI